MNICLFKSRPSISDYCIFNFFILFFSVNRFLILLIIFSSDCFCVLSLFIFFPFPYTVYIGVVILERLTTLSLKLSGIFYRLRNIIKYRIIPNLSQYFCFYILSFPSLYIKKNNYSNLLKAQTLYLNQFKWFRVILSDSYNAYNLHNSCNLHNLYNLHSSHN